MKTLNLNAFVESYLATAAWVTVDSEYYENDSFTREAKEQAEADCKKFISMVCAAFPEDRANELLTMPGNDLTYLAPHDFFLTRNGHGAGFWDKEDTYGIEAAAKLTAIAKECGECYCYHIRGKKSKLTFD